ncbi:sushi domain-containing protein 4-like isoform X2 [Tubulanus polymorphus]|uniref:sushi domain-containing protein 4-like isoform X2 n=1 Tax=Tubulanus polymorphus TaxID=672921 RepID=UPI003DA25491
MESGSSCSKYLCGLMIWVLYSQNPTIVLAQQYCADPGYVRNGYRIPSPQSPNHHVAKKISYRCNKGYKLIGESNVITCTYSGNWVPPYPPVCISVLDIPCGNPPRISYSDYKLYGSNAAYLCMPGYKLADVRANILVCNQGMWVGKRPVCVHEVNCDKPLEISNGNYVIDGTSLPFEAGTKIGYRCNEGYSLVGYSIITCNDAGFWNRDAPQCVRRAGCPNPGVFRFGRFDCPGGHCETFHNGVYDTGTELRFLCNQGYELEGTFVLHCLKNGEWSALAPRCVKATTPMTNFASDHEGQGNTMTIVIITSCTVLGVLLITMIAVAVQRKKAQPRLCTPIPSPPPYNPTYPVGAPLAEHDRLALIAYADQQQVSLPSYEEATRGRVRAHTPLQRLIPANRAHEFRQLPSIPSGIRRQPSSETTSSGGAHRDADTVSRHSTITTSTVNREAFGSIDTVNVSDGTSTSVTVETYDSGASMPSIAPSRRGRAGSLESTASLINEDSLHSTDAQNHEVTSTINEPHSLELEEKDG